MTHARRLSFLFLFLFSFNLVSDAKTTKTITVDCNKKQSINAALTDTSDELTIEVRGICVEDVVVRRDNVTIHGADPTLDGVQGAATVNTTGYGAILIRDSRLVKIDNLLVTGSIRNGIGSHSSVGVEVVNCRLIGNGSNGVAGSGGVVSISNTVINGVNGFGGFEGGLVTCNNCTINVSSIGVLSAGGSRVSVTNSNIIAFYSLVSSQAGSQLTAINSTVDGSLDVEQGSLLMLNNVNQTGNPDLNYVLVGSDFRAVGSTNLVGEMTIEDFSNFSMRGAAAYNGDIYCSFGSDMWCSNPGNITGATYGCNSCVAPPPSLSESLSTGKKSLSKKTPNPRKEERVLEP